MVKVKDWRGTVCSSEHRHVTAGRLSFWTLHLVEASLCGVCTFSPCLCVSSGCSGFLPRSRDMALCGELHVGVNVGSTGCLCLRVSALVTRWQPKDERLSIWMEMYEVMSEVSRKTWMSDSHTLTLLASCSIKPSFYWRRRVMRNIKKKKLGNITAAISSPPGKGRIMPFSINRKPFMWNIYKGSVAFHCFNSFMLSQRRTKLN